MISYVMLDCVDVSFLKHKKTIRDWCGYGIIVKIMPCYINAPISMMAL